MSDPHNPGDVGVTIKVPESKRYAADNPWFVFRGSPSEVKLLIAETFGVEHEGLTLADVTINAQRVASNVSLLSQKLGGTVLGTSPAQPEQAAETQQPAQGGDVWAQAAAAGGGSAPPAWQDSSEQKPPVDPILAALEAATTVEEVQTIWAENQAAFNTNESYMDAYRARGKALMGN